MTDNHVILFNNVTILNHPNLEAKHAFRKYLGHPKPL